MDTQQWILAALLAVSLAASSGLNTFLPLLLLAGAAHFHVAGVQLNGSFGWLASETALIVLGLATLVEVIGDKFPVVDHALDVAGTFVRPVAGALAAASVFKGADPATAAIAGLIVGSPLAFGFHSAKAATRVGSSATTFGCLNPILSFIEDVIAVLLVIIGLFAPLLVPVALCLVILLLWKLVKAVRRRISTS